MVAPLVGAALIGAGGSIISGITGGKGAKKAAQAQQQAAQQQIAAQQATLSQLTALNQPSITRGNEAGSLYGSLVGVGDPASGAAALQTFRNATGYQDLLREGLGSVNANAYARGMGDSGATLKALQSRGAQIANGSFQQYLGNLGTLINAGTQAAGNVSGVTQNVTNNISGIMQNAADAKSNSALAAAANWGNTFQNLANLGASVYGSSYGQNRAQQTNPYGIVMSGQSGYWGGPNGNWAGHGVGGIY